MKLIRLPLDKVLLYFISIVVTILLIFTIRKEFSGPQIAFVDIGRLVDGYQFKKDLEGASNQNLYRIKYIVDSLQMVQQVSGHNPDLDEQINKAQNAMQAYYMQTNQEITKKLWDRLNPLMEQYGKERHLELLIGANGAGTVLYGSAANDVTEDLLRYVNSRYEKGS